jgi:hypothetical protein
MGAVEAAKHLLSIGRVLPVTPWLVEHRRPELTMEHEITQTRWAEVFTDDERADAARRLASAGGPDARKRSRVWSGRGLLLLVQGRSVGGDR